MAKTKFEIAKGVKDWYGQDAVLRNHVRDTLRGVFERYGFVPIETPMLERVDTLGFKGGGEIQKEVFQLKDQGGRELALRFDQTVPLARFVATHRDIKMPFKRYVIGEVFRDGPTQPEQGRYRSFTQCDADILGVRDMTAEAELFALSQDAFDELGLGGVEVKINNRKLLDGVLDYAGVPKEAKIRTIVALDKMDKLSEEGVRQELLDLTFSDKELSLSDDTMKELFNWYDAGGAEVISRPYMKAKITGEISEKGFEDVSEILRGDASRSQLYEAVATYKTKGHKILTPDTVDRLMHATQSSEDNRKTFQKVAALVSSDVGKEGLGEVKQLLDYAEKMGADFVKFDPCLARGLDYYTGTTLEVYLTDKSICSSAILAGGRFDDMVGDFRGDNQEIPAVGFSFGLERLAMVLKDSMNMPSTRTDLYLIPVGETMDDCLAVAHELRKSGLNVDMELQNRRMRDSFDYAHQQGIPYAGLLGGDELAAGTLTVKNLEERTQKTVPLAEVMNYIRK